MTTYYAHRTEPVRDHYVYRCFDAAGRLLYVGCSVRPLTRLREHRTDNKEWVPYVAQVKMQGPFTYKKARSLERQALLTEQPAHGETPLRISAKTRREHWTGRRTVELLEEFGVDLSGPRIDMDEYFAAYGLASEEAGLIDWLTVAREALAAKGVHAA